MLKIILLVVCMFTVKSTFATDFLLEMKQVSSQRNSRTELMSTISQNDWFAVLNTTSTGYRQFYLGPKFNPKSWVEVGAGVGGETTGERLETRIGGYVWVGHDKWSGVVAYENGNTTGLWHKATIKYQVLPEISIGLQNQKYQGSGVRAEWNTGKITFWGTLLGKGVKTTQIGISMNF